MPFAEHRLQGSASASVCPTKQNKADQKVKILGVTYLLRRLSVPEVSETGVDIVAGPLWILQERPALIAVVLLVAMENVSIGSRPFARLRRPEACSGCVQILMVNVAFMHAFLRRSYAEPRQFLLMVLQ